ncbi:MAG TPA: cytochrome c oxidase assembly protein [Gemmatimonadales bacterium]
MILHPGVPPAPHDLWTAWSWDPGIVLPLLAAGWLYAAGLRALWHAAGRGRGVRGRDAAAFALGWLTLVVALVSPLHRLGEALFSAHMIQHELLMAVAAPLLVLGRPLVPFVWALSPAARRAVGRWTGAPAARSTWAVVTHPLTAWGLHAVAIWIWHLPSLYDASVRSELVHALQHASFLGTGLLFWWSVLGASRRGRVRAPWAVLSLFGTALHTTILGALLTFSTRVWYPVYGATTAAWGLTPLEDQQLAGLIMWVPAGLVYLAAALALLASWLGEPEGARPRLPVHALPLLLVLLLPLAGCNRGDRPSREEAMHLTGGGDMVKGRLAIERYGCGACHTIPGIPGARRMVGPPLATVGGRMYIAGMLTNTPQNLIWWIQVPQTVAPGNAMPNLGVSASDARDIAAYLYTRR